MSLCQSLSHMRRSPSCPLFAQPKIDWDQHKTEILKHYRDLIRIGTRGQRKSVTTGGGDPKPAATITLATTTGAALIASP